MRNAKLNLSEINIEYRKKLFSIHYEMEYPNINYIESMGDKEMFEDDVK
jgi:hypothetical protein